LLFDQDIESAEVSRVVCDRWARALYFSRSTLPFYRKSSTSKKVYYKHVGLDAYSNSGLEKIGHLPVCDLEVIEQLEQLRFLFNGLHVQVHENQYETLEIDLPEHLDKARAIFR
jgi:3-deoxy-manno-octulosonate cytidylyltransferase (CMP-KDO synthetase)